MSNFEFIKVETDKVLELRSKYLVKPIARRWKNFPPCCLPESYLNVLERVKEFKIYEDDIILTGYPRSGTTMVAEMIWLIANNFDFEKANHLVTDDRVPGLEYDDMSQMIQKGKLMNTFENLSRPRTIKTHLPCQLLPDEVWVKKPKMIYCSRDPRDVAISIYHFATHFDNITPINDVLEKFLNDRLMYCPYREHRLNFWNIPDYPFILFLDYEFVCSKIDETIRKVSNFLGIKVSDENFLKLKEHLSFDKMKSNKACNNQFYFEKINQLTKQKTNTDDFIRRGKIGGFEDEMPQELIKKFNKWMDEENQLEAGFERN